MIGSIVAKRYALALFQIANEKQLLDQMELELRTVREVTLNNADFKALLNSPKISKENKKQMIKTIFAGISEDVQNTIIILMERSRGQEIPGVATHFIELANEAKGTADAIVYSARPLSETEANSISTTFAASIGKKSLQMNNIVDETLIGGVKVQIGNRIYDGTLRNKLSRLERKLLG
jgi:F-type H+-transporting ATPase subunit delta